MQPTGLHPQRQLGRPFLSVVGWRCRKDSDRIDQAVLVEPSVLDSGMVGISEEIVHSISSEHGSGENLGNNRFPIRERLCFFGAKIVGAECHLCYVLQDHGRAHHPDPVGQRTFVYQCSRDSLVIPSGREQFVLGRM